MSFFKKPSIHRPFILLYPLLVIVAVPALLLLNSFMNLRYFNRDVNYFIRQQGISIAETTIPFFEDAIGDKNQVQMLLNRLKVENSEVISASILRTDDDRSTIVASSENTTEVAELSKQELNNFAEASGQSFAGLSHDPFVGENVWNVSVPFSQSDNNYILALKLSTDTVESVLNRTSRDSLIILTITTIITLVLLANHFIFYRRALHAQQLAEIDRLKDEFISLASHELRAPVTAIVGYLEMLENKLGPDTASKVNHELETLNRVTNDLNNLINDLLEVSRIEQDRLQINMDTVDVNRSAEDAIDKFKPQAEQKGLKLKFEPGELPKIKSDPNRVRQIIVNLLSNAIKYTNEGEIKITTTKEDNIIKVVVKDTGVGIPPEQVDKLFSKFHRIKDEKTPEAKGTGLGLWITKKIVETLGGNVYVESIYGTGSSFSFTLPIGN